MFQVSDEKPVRGALLFPQNHDRIADFDLDWADHALDVERRYWAGLALQRNRLEVGDADVQAMVIASARNILQAREIEDGLPVFKVGPTIYRNLFVVDGHFFLEAAQYLGYADDAAAGVETLVNRFQDDGSISLIPNHFKETAIALATLVRQAELSDDWTSLRSRWTLVQQAVNYIQTLRRTARALPADDAMHGLMPEGYCDGGLGGKRPEYSTTLWTLFGLKEITRAARFLGYADDADRFAEEYRSMLTDFRTHLAKTMGDLADTTTSVPMRIPSGSGDHHWIPEYPLEVPPWHRVNPGTATWALAQSIYPGELFPAQDPIVQNLCTLLDQIDDAEGIPAETGWLPYKALWGYAASFYAHVWMYAGRFDKAIDYLYAFANHAAPTRIWREEQSLTDSQHGQLFGDMPHNWASVEFIRLVRNLLVFERGDLLELLPGLPAEWLRVGDVVVVEAMPTRFGPISLHVVLNEAGQLTTTVNFDCERTRLPERVWLHLPDGVRVEDPAVDGNPVSFVGDAVEVPLQSQVVVTVYLSQ